MNDKNTLTLSYRITSTNSQGQTEEMLVKQAMVFEEKKLLSPGIFQACAKQLEEFLQIYNNRKDIPPKDAIAIHKLQASELEALAKLVEDGSRVLNATVYEYPGVQAIILKLQPAEKR